MPIIDLEFLGKLHDDYKKYPCFIETGTLNGSTTLRVEPYFDKLHSIEISKKYHSYTKNKYLGHKINFILGDSSLVFIQLLPTITDNCVFFLDGHWSGGDTGRSIKDCPLNEEITQINDLFQHDAIIIITRFSLFGVSSPHDWSNINKYKLLAILQPRIKRVYHLDNESVKNDLLIIHIRAK
jgi:hypothetical protein